MTFHTRSLRWLALQKILPVLAVILGCFLAGSATSAAPTADVPDNLRVEGTVIARVQAKGYQVYTCKADTSGKLSWTLKAPDATFQNDTGLTGKHYAGPTWESTVDGSKVVGKKIADHASPEVDAVPWLLLAAASHEGTGIFSQVTFIQRINTTGGKAPAVGNAKAGDEVRVAYTAEYVFYGSGATTQP
jgi:hypothetical protein